MVRCMVLSADEHKLAVAVGTNVSIIFIYDADTGTVLNTHTGFGCSIKCLAFVPRGAKPVTTAVTDGLPFLMTPIAIAANTRAATTISKAIGQNTTARAATRVSGIGQASETPTDLDSRVS